MPPFVVVPYDTADPSIVAALSPGDRARLAALSDDAGAERRLLAGRSALLLAAARLGERDILIDATCPDCGRSHGRPTAPGAEAPLYLSLAHAAGAAFAVASRTPVGIDAEPVMTPPARLAAIDALAPGRSHPLRRWTAAEAVLKADGRGLRVAPGEVRLGFRRARLDDRRYRVRTTHAAGCVVTVAELLPPADGRGAAGTPGRPATLYPESDGSRV
ncbi:4'-phosphopantetheinyl transferase family protein [Leifsonia sp. 22587]|uniref:4'-phosphopantetheinyl transferase family protein n=1 Tax=Leifsonia sp. 22587 TaxID=3453946 RepID=UPI003F8356BE